MVRVAAKCVGGVWLVQDLLRAMDASQATAATDRLMKVSDRRSGSVDFYWIALVWYFGSRPTMFARLQINRFLVDSTYY